MANVIDVVNGVVQTAINNTATASGSSNSNSSNSINLFATQNLPTAATTSDSDEFKGRYMSLDSLQAREDGSDMAYVRILKFDNGKFGNQVFPTEPATVYKKMIVTDIRNNYVEKSQIIKTNNTLQVYAFDSQIEVFTISGFLKSTMEDRWDTAMRLLWDNIFRLSKLIENKRIAELGIGDDTYWGYPLTFSTGKSSQAQYVASFNMQFLVYKRHEYNVTNTYDANEVNSQILSLG